MPALWLLRGPRHTRVAPAIHRAGAREAQPPRGPGFLPTLDGPFSAGSKPTYDLVGTGIQVRPCDMKNIRILIR